MSYGYLLLDPAKTNPILLENKALIKDFSYVSVDVAFLHYYDYWFNKVEVVDNAGLWRNTAKIYGVSPSN